MSAKKKAPARAKGQRTAEALEYPIRCRTCGLFYEKGAKPQKGQDDSLFQCDLCAAEVAPGA